MTDEAPERPEPKTDDDPERAPGGVDASINESDVGAASGEEPLTPDPPFSAQQDEDDVPDAVQEPESTEQANEGETSEPTD
jgi:hypothetical protein